MMTRAVRATVLWIFHSFGIEQDCIQVFNRWVMGEIREPEHTFRTSGLISSVPGALVVFSERRASATSEVSIDIQLS